MITLLKCDDDNHYMLMDDEVSLDVYTDTILGAFELFETGYVEPNTDWTLNGCSIMCAKDVTNAAKDLKENYPELFI